MSLELVLTISARRLPELRRQKIRRLFQNLSTMYSLGQLFVAFNVALFVGVGGALAILCFLSDSYSPLPLDALHLVPVGLAAVPALVLFAGLISAVQDHKKLKNTEAIALCLGLLELAFFVFTTWQLFTLPLTSRKEEARQDIATMIEKMNKNRPVLEDDDTLHFQSVFYRGRTLTLRYELAGNAQGYYIDSKRQAFIKQACGYFSKFPERTVLANVSYMISFGQNKGMINFLPKDCVPETKQMNVASETTSSAPIPTMTVTTPPPTVQNQRTIPMIAAAPNPLGVEDFDVGALEQLIGRVTALQKSVDQMNQTLGVVVKNIDAARGIKP